MHMLASHKVWRRCLPVEALCLKRGSDFTIGPMGFCVTALLNSEKNVSTLLTSLAKHLKFTLTSKVKTSIYTGNVLKAQL